MKRTYQVLAVILFLIELAITFTDGFVRHTFGDFIVVILLYCLIKSIITISNKAAAIIVLLFSFAIEFIQLTTLSQSEIFNKLPFLKLILGTTFQWGDLVAYTLGILFTLFIEKRFHNN